MTRHQLKLNTKYFDAVQNGVKSFEVRKHDRNYQIGDTLDMLEVFDDGVIGARMFRMTIVFMLTHDDFPEGICEGYCVLGVKKVASPGV